MAIKNSITNLQVYFYLAYFISRINRTSIEFDTLPFEIASANQDQILGAFDALRKNNLIASFTPCDDGVHFRKTEFLTTAI